MPRLLLLRHAKSSWDDPSLADFDRPINLRGRATAPLMGRHMLDHRLVPDRVLCSSARRTRDSVAAILPYLSGDFDISFLYDLYAEMNGDYRQIIAREAAAAKALLVVGHNDAIQRTALQLIGRGNPSLRDQIAAKFPTAALAVIDFDEPWDRLGEASGRIVAFFRPRELELVDTDQSEPDE